MAQPPSDRPCPDCAHHDRTDGECLLLPSCLAHRGVRHLEQWGCCDDCIAEIDRALADLLELHALASLPEYLLPAWSGSGQGGPSSERPIGVNVAALDLAHGESLLGVLESWERWWREHWHLSPYGAASSAYTARHAPETPGMGSTATSRTLSGVVGFLRANWPRAAAQVEPPPDEFAAEVRQLHRAALAALSLTRFDLDPDPDAKEPADYAVPCPGCGLTIGMHRQPRTIDGHHDPVRLNCERCGWHGTGEWLIRVAVASGARPAMSLHQVMAMHGVTESTVRRMVARGELRRVRGMYTVNDQEVS